jgi:hypothetical protein
MHKENLRLQLGRFFSLPKTSRLFSQSLITFIFYCSMQLSTWLPLRFWKIWGGGKFIDIGQVLRFADCYRTTGLGVYQSPHNDCSGYLYGRSLIQILNFLYLGVGATQYLGYLFLTILSLAISVALPWNSLRTFYVSVVVLTSPPILLLAERGNFDILIFAMVILGSYFFSKGREIISILVFFMITLFKYYTLPLLAVTLILSRRASTKILGLFLFILSIPLIFRDIKITKSGFPASSGAKFGMKIWYEYFLDFLPHGISIITGLLACASFFIATVLVILYLFRTKVIPREKILSRTLTLPLGELIFLFSGVTFISCYIVGISFDYRLVFCSILILELPGTKSVFTKKIDLVLIFVSLWLSYPCGGLQPIGDLCLEIYAAGLTIRIVQSLRTRLSWRFDPPPFDTSALSTSD